MNESMCNKDRLLQMYRYAVSNAMCSNKKEFAKLLGITSQNLSNALSDNFYERFCTKGLLLKANNALGNVFSANWVTHGEGEMYANNSNNVPVPTPTPTPTHAYKTITPSYDEDDIEYLRKRVKELEYLVDLQKKRIEQLESEAKKGYASVSVS